MIIDKEHKFVFVHIPKCAGTSVRTILDRFDSYNGRFKVSAAQHPVLGTLDMAHMPLATLRRHFPEEYSQVAAYTAFAIVRDPFSRFPSSMYQRLWKHTSSNVKELSRNEVRAAIDDAMTYLSANTKTELLRADYIHFQKQNSYVFDQGKKLIDRLYTPSRMDALLKDVGLLTGDSTLDDKRSNTPHIQRSVFYRNSLVKAFAPATAKVWSYIDKPVRYVTPVSVKKAVQNLVYASSREKYGDLFEAQYVKDFISAYYSDDIELYKRVEAE